MGTQATVAVPDLGGARVNVAAVLEMHAPDLARARDALAAEVTAIASEAPLRQELVRLRVAEATGCEWCRNVRYRDAVDAGLSEDLVDGVRGKATLDLGEADTEALAITETFLMDPAAGLEGSALSQPEQAGVVLNLVARLSLGKCVVAFGLEPEAMEVTVL